jgi:3-isopropylmalate dehydrogenase
MESRQRRLTELVHEGPLPHPAAGRQLVLGLLDGEGVGPEVMEAARHVLAAVESSFGYGFDLRSGSAIGIEAESQGGKALSDEVVSFCEQIFAEGGAVLAGPGGGRFVYDLRKRFDLFCKLNPLFVHDELQDMGRLKPCYTKGVDVMVVRENVSGIYQGEHFEERSINADRRVHYRFSYSESEVDRILRIAARVACARRGRLAVVVKSGGLPGLSELWRESAARVASEFGVEPSLIDIDYAAYLMVHSAQDLDVVAAPNLFGDVLSDLGGILLGSRGLSYGASFGSRPIAVYQTNHGAAWNLAGRDRANPVGQIFSLAMMLRESYALHDAAAAVEGAVRHVWRCGWRTDDLASPSCRTVGTRKMGELVAEAVAAGTDRIA